VSSVTYVIEQMNK